MGMRSVICQIVWQIQRSMIRPLCPARGGANMIKLIWLTSIEQKIHKTSVCTTTSAALPIPNAKYIPMYLPTSGLKPSLSLTSAHFLSQTLPPVHWSASKMHAKLLVPRISHLGKSCRRKIKFHATWLEH